MLYARSRHSVPSARYGAALDVMEALGWTYEQYLAAPYDLIDEEMIRLQKRALAQKPRG